MKVLFVGQNPSKHNTNKDMPFLGSKSYTNLKNWIDILEVKNPIFVNVFTQLKPTYNKRSLEVASDNVFLKIFVSKPDKIIALGKIAGKVLKIGNNPHFELPHPSGRNRKLNNKKWLNQQLALAKKYLEVK